MIINRIITEQDVPLLLDLWLECFDEKRKAAELFFERNKGYVHGYLAEKDSAVIAAVYLVDGTLDGVKAHYLCGAATRPNHRRQGVMTSLITFALADAQRRGDRYSLLLPAEDRLYRFYAGLGYQATCAVCTRQFDCGTVRKSPGGVPDGERLQLLCEHSKFLLWNQNFMSFAADYYACYGVSSVQSADVFALYEQDGAFAEVFYAVYHDINELKALLHAQGVQTMSLSGGVSNPLFAGQTPQRCGMIKSLTDKAPPEGIYLGITLS